MYTPLLLLLIKSASSRYATRIIFVPPYDCEAEIDYEIGPDESLEDVLDTAELIQKIEGEEEVEKMDTLLSLALTGGDYSWI